MYSFQNICNCDSRLSSSKLVSCMIDEDHARADPFQSQDIFTVPFLLSPCLRGQGRAVHCPSSSGPFVISDHQSIKMLELGENGNVVSLVTPRVRWCRADHRFHTQQYVIFMFDPISIVYVICARKHQDQMYMRVWWRQLMSISVCTTH